MTDPPVSPPPRRPRALLRSGLGYLGMAVVLALIFFAAFPLPWVAKPTRNNCWSNVKQLGLAMAMYASDYDQHLPFATDWPQRIFPYVNNTQLYLCPMAPEPGLPRGGNMPVNYGMNVRANELDGRTLPDPAHLALLFDSTEIYGGQAIIAFRHRDHVAYFAFADGHSGYLTHGRFLSNPFTPEVMSQPGLKVTPLPAAKDLPPLPPPPKLP